MRGTGWLNDFYRNDQKNWTQERVCERCEKKYTATARRQKYCLDCKEIVPQERYRKKNPKAKLIGETLECPTCQTTFEKSKPSQEYCSFKCAYTQRKKRMVEKYRAEHPDYTPKAEATIASDTTKFCLFCEKEFVFRHPNQMHCSHACKVKSLDKRRDRSGASRQADESICPDLRQEFHQNPRQPEILLTCMRRQPLHKRTESHIRLRSQLHTSRTGKVSTNCLGIKSATIKRLYRKSLTSYRYTSTQK